MVGTYYKRIRIHQFKRDQGLGNNSSANYTCQYCGLCLCDVARFEITLMDKKLAICKKGKKLDFWEACTFTNDYYANCLVEDRDENSSV